MRARKYRRFMCDFETTVYEGQESTEVWAAACVELGTEDVTVYHSLDELFSYFRSIRENVMAYFHNLKFDGSFWLDWLLRNPKYTQAYIKHEDDSGVTEYEWLKDKYMPPNSYKYSISDRGQWYTFTIRTNQNIIEIRDSLKLLPSSVAALGKAFSSRQKLDMEYKGFRFPGCYISDQEKEYISNDVLIPKEALEAMQKLGHTKLTIGSCCLSEFKNIVGKDEYAALFPDLTQVECPLEYIDLLDTERGRFANADAYIRKAYRGGWVYVEPSKQKKVLGPGLTADVNSLYPSVMHSDGGYAYPIGKPKWWRGNYIPEEAKDSRHYYYVRIRTMFHVKHGYLPFIQIKGSFLYEGTRCLETSDVDGNSEVDWFGKTVKTRVTLTLAKTDFELFLKHYDVTEFEILDGCVFGAIPGIFDDYINKHAEIKMKSKGAMRNISKLFLNNLYGKLASNDNSSFKVAELNEAGEVKFVSVEAHEKQAGHIASGAAVTAAARCFTITAAQLNYHGPGQPGFCYADTDSIHCDIPESELVGCPVHPTAFNHWKIESHWDKAFFTRQKTYIEHVVDGDPWYDIKCAGMTKTCKELFIKSLNGEYRPSEGDSIELRNLIYSQAGREFLLKNRTIEDFVPGLKVPGKLRPIRIKGGVLLHEEEYTMHG